MVISFATYSQNYYEVTSCRLLIYETGDWKSKKTTFPKDMYIKIDEQNISINNENESNYDIYGDCEKTNHTKHTTYTWSAYDKEGNDCTIMLKINKKSKASSISIYYFEDLYGFEYYLKD